MKFTLTIDCDNAAFEGDNLGPELSRILRRIADVTQPLESSGVAEAGGIRFDSGAFADYNGNQVAQAQLTDD